MLTTNSHKQNSSKVLLCHTKTNSNLVDLVPYQIYTGNLCKIITAYGEPVIADLLLGSGTGNVSKPYIKANFYDITTNTGTLKQAILHTDQCVMFLRSFSETESLVLSGAGYFVVLDKNLEPVIDLK